MKKKNRVARAVWFIFAACLLALVFAPASYASIIVVDGGDPNCIPSGAGPAYCTIQGGINAAVPNDVVQVAAGVYAEQLVLTTDNVTVAGSGQATTIIDGTATVGYHFQVAADGATLQDFTLLGNSSSSGSYGLKIEGDTGTMAQHLNITVQNVTVDGTYRTGVDLNGINGAVLTNVTVRNVPWGVGVATTDVDNATLTNITTQNNAWGGVGIYTLGTYFPDGPSDNINIVSLAAAESNPLYWEEDCSGGCPVYPITNFTAPQFTHAVRNDTHRAGGDHFTYFQYSESAAIDAALALATPDDSRVNEFSGAPGVFGDFIVGTNGGGAMSIQTAVDAAVAADTVWLRDGTYEERVYIDKDITLTGQGSTAVIESPASVPTCFTTSSAKHAIVCVENTAAAVIEYVTVDGAGKGNANYQFVGVGFHNASGQLTNSTITRVRDTPFSGTQHGVAVYSWQEDGAPHDLGVIDNVIVDFQKNAMALNANGTTPMTVTVSGNVITGAGATTVTAQNGVQVWGDLITGNISNNVISGIAYDNTNNPTKWAATSILNYYADVNITGNQVFGGHLGVYNIDGAGTISGNAITVAKVGVYAYGIIATDPPDAVPSPYAEAAASVGAGGGGRALLNVAIDNNFVLFSGPDNSATYGIEADAGYGADNLAVTANGNVVRGFDVGVGFYECQSGCAAGVFVTLAAANNCIENNNTGMWSNVSVPAGNPVLAENNWWGAADGPGPTGSGNPVVGSIDFDPYLAVSNCAVVSPGDWQNLTTGTYYALLQDAVDAATSGDEIIATGPGPYPGAVIGTAGVKVNLNGATLNEGSPAVTVTAANVTVANGVLDGLGSSFPGVLVSSGGNNLILDDLEITGWVDGVRLDDGAPYVVTSFKLVNSYIHDNSGAGLLVGANATLNGVITIEGNLFKANGGDGVTNLNGVSLDATYNSWGCYAGPGTAGCDTASADVVSSPWTFAEMYLDMDPPADAASVNVLEGETFAVDLKLDMWNVTTLEFDFIYDSTMLTLNGAPTFPAPWTGTCTPIAGAANQVHYTCSLFYPAPGYSAVAGTIAQLSFTAEDNGGLTGAGGWTAYFDLNHQTSTVSTIGGVKVFVNNAGYGVFETRDFIDDGDDGAVNIAPTANFNGFVDLQGRTNDAGATLTVYDNQVRAAATALSTGSSDSSGAYQTSGALLSTAPTYWLYVDAPLYLPTTADASLLFGNSGMLTTRPLTTLNLLLLLGGDATDDNIINILDATCIGTDFGTSGSTCSSGNSDVNGDGVINILDLSLMGGNFGTLASPWVP